MGSVESAPGRGEPATELLLDLARALHESACPADVAEERMRGVAAALGLEAEFFTMQSFFATELRRGDRERVEIRRMPFDTHWNLAETAELDDLCRAIIDRRLDVGAARAELTRLASRKSAYSKGLVALAWAIYGGVVAIRVGGHWIEGLAGALIGVVAGGVHLLAGRHKQVSLEKTFLGAFLGSIAAFLLAFVLP